MSGAAGGPLLAVDASTLEASVALVAADGRLLGRWRQAPGERGTARLASATAELLDAAGVTVSGLSGLVVGTGPGSYTGLRAAIAFVRGLALPASLPLAGVASVAAAARAALLDDPGLAEVVTVLDARRGECYRADYERDGDATRTKRAPCLVPATEIEALEREASQGRVVLREPAVDAGHLAALGRPRLAAGGDPPATVLPLYLKRSHAEIALEQRARGT
jgi:tRNA threonylcarbamoyl adenosine modification protein YeaZ